MNIVLLEDVHWTNGDFSYSMEKKSKEEKETIEVSLDAKLSKETRSKLLFRLKGVAIEAGQLSHDLFDNVYDLVLVPRTSSEMEEPNDLE